MKQLDARTFVSAFNDCINAADIEGLSRWMADDHVFIDAVGNAVSGKNECLEAWRAFFAAFPDYRNSFDRMAIVNQGVAIVGSSSCAEPSLAGPALWTAKIRDSLISEWRVLEDTELNRRALGLSG